ncbi:hypothetical protein, partial [Streptomyces rochei]
MPLKVRPKATPRPVIAGPTEPAKSALKDFHHGDLKPADTRSCSPEMASAAARTNGVSPGSEFFSPFRALVKIG